MHNAKWQINGGYINESRLQDYSAYRSIYDETGIKAYDGQEDLNNYLQLVKEFISPYQYLDIFLGKGVLVDESNVIVRDNRENGGSLYRITDNLQIQLVSNNLDNVKDYKNDIAVVSKYYARQDYFDLVSVNNINALLLADSKNTNILAKILESDVIHKYYGIFFLDTHEVKPDETVLKIMMNANMLAEYFFICSKTNNMNSDQIKNYIKLFFSDEAKLDRILNSYCISIYSSLASKFINYKGDTINKIKDHVKIVNEEILTNKETTFDKLLNAMTIHFNRRSKLDTKFPNLKFSDLIDNMYINIISKNSLILSRYRIINTLSQSILKKIDINKYLMPYKQSLNEYIKKTNTKNYSPFQYSRSFGIPDCVETGIRNCICSQIYNGTSKLNYERLHNILIPDAYNFFVKYNTIKSQQNSQAYDEWFTFLNTNVYPIIIGNPNFPKEYVLNNRENNYSDAKSSPRNFLVILSIILGIDISLVENITDDNYYDYYNRMFMELTFGPKWLVEPIDLKNIGDNNIVIGFRTFIVNPRVGHTAVELTVTNNTNSQYIAIKKILNSNDTLSPILSISHENIDDPKYSFDEVIFLLSTLKSYHKIDIKSAEKIFINIFENNCTRENVALFFSTLHVRSLRILNLFLTLVFKYSTIIYTGGNPIDMKGDYKLLNTKALIKKEDLLIIKKMRIIMNNNLDLLNDRDIPAESIVEKLFPNLQDLNISLDFMANIIENHRKEYDIKRIAFNQKYKNIIEKVPTWEIMEVREFLEISYVKNIVVILKLKKLSKQFESMLPSFGEYLNIISRFEFEGLIFQTHYNLIILNNYESINKNTVKEYYKFFVNIFKVDKIKDIYSFKTVLPNYRTILEIDNNLAKLYYNRNTPEKINFYYADNTVNKLINHIDNLEGNFNPFNIVPTPLEKNTLDYPSSFAKNCTVNVHSTKDFKNMDVIFLVGNEARIVYNKLETTIGYLDENLIDYYFNIICIYISSQCVMSLPSKHSAKIMQFFTDVTRKGYMYTNNNIVYAHSIFVDYYDAIIQKYCEIFRSYLVSIEHPNIDERMIDHYMYILHIFQTFFCNYVDEKENMDRGSIEVYNNTLAGRNFMFKTIYNNNFSCKEIFPYKTSMVHQIILMEYENEVKDFNLDIKPMKNNNYRFTCDDFFCDVLDSNIIEYFILTKHNPSVTFVKLYKNILGENIINLLLQKYSYKILGNFYEDKYVLENLQFSSVPNNYFCANFFKYLNEYSIESAVKLFNYENNMRAISKFAYRKYYTKPLKLNYNNILDIVHYIINIPNDYDKQMGYFIESLYYIINIVLKYNIFPGKQNFISDIYSLANNEVSWRKNLDAFIMINIASLIKNDINQHILVYFINRVNDYEEGSTDANKITLWSLILFYIILINQKQIKAEIISNTLNKSSMENKVLFAAIFAINAQYRSKNKVVIGTNSLINVPIVNDQLINVTKFNKIFLDKVLTMIETDNKLKENLLNGRIVKYLINHIERLVKQSMKQYQMDYQYNSSM